MKKARLDTELVARGFYESAEEALRAIIAGDVLVNDERAKSAAQLITPECTLRVKSKNTYVSRGGHKLKAGLDAFNIAVTRKSCLDIGSSTGGFTDALLQAGAERVTCVDVNYGQLAWKIRTDARTTVFERTNIKYAEPQALGAPFDLIVIDVSFIGLAELALTLASLIKPEGELLALIKPQFESQRGETEGGVVYDEAVRLRCIEEVKEALAHNGFNTLGTIESPLRGPAGNIEYLLYAVSK